MVKKHRRQGYQMILKENMNSDFDEFLVDDSIYEDVNDIAIKRVIAYQIEEEMKAQNITKTKMAELMNTSRGASLGIL